MSTPEDAESLIGQIAFSHSIFCGFLNLPEFLSCGHYCCFLRHHSRKFWWSAAAFRQVHGQRRKVYNQKKSELTSKLTLFLFLFKHECPTVANRFSHPTQQAVPKVRL